MRTLLITGAVTVALAGTAIGQMCGAPQPASTTAQAGMMGGCMGMMRQAQAVPQPSQPQMGGMMCPCCKAMMGGMRQETPKAEPKNETPK
jgi:hypothetical protein